MRQPPEIPDGISIEEIFEEGTLIDEALRDAVREAILRHKQAGNPIAVWKDEKVVWIPPEEIEVEPAAPG